MDRLLRRAAASLLCLFAGLTAASALAKPQFCGAPPMQLKSANAKGLKSQAVAIRFNAGEMLDMRASEEVELTLPNGMTYDVTLDLVTPHGEGISSWIGQLKGFGNDYRVIVTTGPAGSFG